MDFRLWTFDFRLSTFDFRLLDFVFPGANEDRIPNIHFSVRRSRISSFNPRVAFASLPYPGLLSLSPSGSENMRFSIIDRTFGLWTFDFWTIRLFKPLPCNS
ncbi:hypothetical protein ALGA_0253 [Labilibaculum antarcticum]|uniref:Uncharacterized protein n=1 Tax=Labilibaculum antarcticum TaxID=1717717 RepID=A0A1Y1CE66_9BACT|nr:hypothetical protein ALGA_0253 [Labilibaculum antarcticum]